MQIWLDGDACPKVIKEILYRAVLRTQTILTIISSQCITAPASPLIKKWQVTVGIDAADNQIIASVQPGDLIITADIPLADAVIAKHAIALNPRGELYTSNNIKSHLALRNFNESLRSNGLLTGGPAKLTAKDSQNFANALDQWLRNSINQHINKS